MQTAAAADLLLLGTSTLPRRLHNRYVTLCVWHSKRTLPHANAMQRKGFICERLNKHTHTHAHTKEEAIIGNGGVNQLELTAIFIKVT